MYLGAIERFSVDLKADAPTIPDKIDHATLPQERFVLADEQHACLCQSVDAGLRMLSFGRAEEDDLARVPVLHRACRFDGHGMRADDLSRDNGLQYIKKRWISAVDADQQGGRTIRQSAPGPLCKFCEIEKVGRLDLVFRCILLTPHRKLNQQKFKKQESQSNP